MKNKEDTIVFDIDNIDDEDLNNFHIPDIDHLDDSDEDIINSIENEID